MHEYQLIEFSYDRKQFKVVSDKSNLKQVLAEFYKENFEKCLRKMVVQRIHFCFC